MTEDQRHIVLVRDVESETTLCAADVILHDVPEGELRGDLYPAAMLDEGRYVLWIDFESWPVHLLPSESKPSPAMVIQSDTAPPIPDSN
ncbi:MAG: hypothetical protein QF681_09475 [Vicinamibacterales bacterium]|nr:hypothetical protein [Vicinamibacterales bacterium]